MQTFNDLFKYATTKNITIFTATQPTVDFPSSSPYVTSCGGTTLCKKNILCEYDECAWNNNRTSYQSNFFKKPKYQQNVSYDKGNKRIIPDIAAISNPMTGYIVVFSEPRIYNNWRYWCCTTIICRISCNN